MASSNSQGPGRPTARTTSSARKSAESRWTSWGVTLRGVWERSLEMRALWMAIFVLVGTWSLLPKRALPAPDLGDGAGTGPTIGAASWQWGVTPDCAAPEGANAFIEFALQPQYLAMWSNTIGLFPASQAALDQTELYQEGGPLEVFFDLSEAQAVIRPPTPGYATMALIFREALLDIANGADVQTTLDAAVDEIEADIEANNGYGFTE